jgi:hypothetical protein
MGQYELLDKSDTSGKLIFNRALDMFFTLIYYMEGIIT